MKPYPRPELTEGELIQARMDAMKLVRKYSIQNLPEICKMLIIENIRLTKEIQEHRAARGFAPLITFEV